MKEAMYVYKSDLTCQINDTGPQLFPRQPQFCRFDVPTCSKSIMDQLTHQIHKTEAALEYAIIDLKPPRLWVLKKKNKVLECLYFMFFVVDPIQQAHKWSEIISKEDFSFS